MDYKFLVLCAALAYIAASVWEITKKVAEAKVRPVYRCKFERTVIPYGKDSEHSPGSVRLVAAQDFIELPFPPYIGLEISDDLEKVKYDERRDMPFYSGKIINVQWNNFASVFFCKAEPHMMAEGNVLAAVLHMHIRQGWKPGFLGDEDRRALEEWQALEETKNRRRSQT